VGGLPLTILQKIQAAEDAILVFVGELYRGEREDVDGDVDVDVEGSPNRGVRGTRREGVSGSRGKLGSGGEAETGVEMSTSF
jgi:hypothetical protein